MTRLDDFNELHPCGVSVASTSAAALAADVIAVGVFQDETTIPALAEPLNEALKGLLLQELQASPTFKGKTGQSLTLHTHYTVPAKWVVLVGLGKRASLTSQVLRRAAASAVRAAVGQKAQHVGLVLVDPCAETAETMARVQAEGALLGPYKFEHRKGQKKDAKKDSEADKTSHLGSVTILVSPETEADSASGLGKGDVIARAVNKARDLVFDSANHLTPTVLATLAQRIAADSGGSVACKILDQPELEQLGMGAFLGVAKGSEQAPKLIHLTYNPEGAPQKKVAFVGKGITFDSGGYSLKPAKSMELMKDDMAGAAAVLCTMRALSQLKNLPYRVDVIVPACENMVSGRATKPGDIHTAMDGTTIEVNNTDAEGRLILCDALTYAQRECEPEVLLDLATLTGACIVALGKDAAGIMGTDEGLIETLRKVGDVAGERYWPLPLYDDYKRFLKSAVADLINSGNGMEAGSSAGGMFLKHFIRDGQAWAHLDIAGPAYTDRDYPEVPKGASGFAVRTLLYYLYQFPEL